MELDAGGGPDPEAERQRALAIGKVGRRLLPLLFVGAFFAQVDRVNVSMASLQMNDDIGLSPGIFGLGVSAFFLIYALCEIPSNAGLIKFGARRWIARIMMTWGVVTVSTAFIVGPTSFVINRVLLGAAEAGYLPGVLAYLSTWLPASARSRFFSIFLMAIPVANVLGGPLASAILSMNGALGLRGWQWLFIIEGLPSVLLAFVILRQLPDHPRSASWLTQEDARLLCGPAPSGQDAPDHLTLRRFFEAIISPRILLFTLVLGCLGGVTQGVTFWLPQIVKGMGYTVGQTGFVIAIPFLVGACVMVLWSAHSDRTGERRWHLAAPAIASGAALALAVLLPGNLTRIACVTVAITGILAIQGIFWSTVSLALEGAERAIGMATISAGALLFAFLAPTLIGFTKQVTGHFELAFVVLGVLGIVGGSLALVMASSVNQPRRLAD